MSWQVSVRRFRFTIAFFSSALRPASGSEGMSTGLESYGRPTIVSSSLLSLSIRFSVMSAAFRDAQVRSLGEQEFLSLKRKV
jgi:hypothetical protein